MTEMAKKTIRCTKIGLGNDVVDTYWREFLGYRPVTSNASSLKVKTTFSNYWRCSQELTLKYQGWGGDMPGRDGIWIDVYTRSKEGAKVLKALKLIVSRLRSSHAA